MLIVFLAVCGVGVSSAFAVASGSTSHIKLPGVIVQTVTVAGCLGLYSRVPARHIWGRLTALILTLPILLVTVDSWTRYFAFGVW